jgi:hypothetical protein
MAVLSIGRRNALPSPPDRYEQSYMAQLVDALRAAINHKMDNQSAVSFFYLQSDGGKVFRVSVSDSGVLSATQVVAKDGNETEVP